MSSSENKSIDAAAN